MPVFSRDNQRILFVHIPKTGGSSIETYFASCGWGVDYIDRSNPDLFESPNFYRRVSPQHMHARLLSETFELSRFDLIFTILRDPLERFRSEFAYRNPGIAHSEVSEKHVEDWWFSQKFELTRNPSHLDNHLRSQKEFLLPNMKIFLFDRDLRAAQRLAEGSIENGYEAKLKGSPTPLPHCVKSWNHDSPTPLSRRLQRELSTFYRQDLRLIDKLKKE